MKENIGTREQELAAKEAIRRSDKHFAGEFLTISEQVSISKELAAKLGHPVPVEEIPE